MSNRESDNLNFSQEAVAKAMSNYRTIVQELIRAREAAGITQERMATINGQEIGEIKKFESIEGPAPSILWVFMYMSVLELDFSLAEKSLVGA